MIKDRIEKMRFSHKKNDLTIDDFFTGQYCSCGGEIWSYDYGYNCKMCGRRTTVSPETKLYIQNKEGEKNDTKAHL